MCLKKQVYSEYAKATTPPQRPGSGWGRFPGSGGSGGISPRGTAAPAGFAGAGSSAGSVSGISSRVRVFSWEIHPGPADGTGPAHLPSNAPCQAPADPIGVIIGPPQTRAGRSGPAPKTTNGAGCLLHVPRPELRGGFGGLRRRPRYLHKAGNGPFSVTPEIRRRIMAGKWAASQTTSVAPWGRS